MKIYKNKKLINFLSLGFRVNLCSFLEFGFLIGSLMYLEHLETTNIFELTSLLLCYKSNKKQIFLDKPTGIIIILRTMKSTGGKIAKEASKEASKELKQTSPTTLNKLNQNKSPSLPINNMTSSPVEEESSKKLANISPISPRNFTSLPTLSNLKEPIFISRTAQFAPYQEKSQRDYRGVRLADPDNMYYDNPEKSKRHRIT